MSKTYKPQRLGGSIYICIPPSFFTPAMLRDGVRLTLLRKGARDCIFRMEEANEEHPIGIEASGEDAQELGTADNVREAD